MKKSMLKRPASLSVELDRQKVCRRDIKVHKPFELTSNRLSVFSLSLICRFAGTTLTSDIALLHSKFARSISRYATHVRVEKKCYDEDLWECLKTVKEVVTKVPLKSLGVSVEGLICIDHKLDMNSSNVLKQLRKIHLINCELTKELSEEKITEIGFTEGFSINSASIIRDRWLISFIVNYQCSSSLNYIHRGTQSICIDLALADAENPLDFGHLYQFTDLRNIALLGVTEQRFSKLIKYLHDKKSQIERIIIHFKTTPAHEPILTQIYDMECLIVVAFFNMNCSWNSLQSLIQANATLKNVFISKENAPPEFAYKNLPNFVRKNEPHIIQLSYAG